jgi:hypothetical protein
VPGLHPAPWEGTRAIAEQEDRPAKGPSRGVANRALIRLRLASRSRFGYLRGLCSGKGFVFADRGEFVEKGLEEPVCVSQVRRRGRRSHCESAGLTARQASGNTFNQMSAWPESGARNGSFRSGNCLGVRPRQEMRPPCLPGRVPALSEAERGRGFDPCLSLQIRNQRLMTAENLGASTKGTGSDLPGGTAVDRLTTDTPPPPICHTDAGRAIV